MRQKTDATTTITFDRRRRLCKGEFARRLEPQRSQKRDGLPLGADAPTSASLERFRRTMSDPAGKEALDLAVNPSHVDTGVPSDSTFGNATQDCVGAGAPRATITDTVRLGSRGLSITSSNAILHMSKFRKTHSLVRSGYCKNLAK